MANRWMRISHSDSKELDKYLFVGESIPHNGTFFYYGASILHRHTLRAFVETFKGINGANFLETFKKLGFYLDDLCSEPVNQLKEGDDRKRRVRLRKLYEDDLSERVGQPEVVIVTPKEIRRNVERVLSVAGLAVPLHDLPFPVRDYDEKYVSELSGILKELFRSHPLLKQ